MKSRNHWGPVISEEKLLFWTTPPKKQLSWRINLLLDMEFEAVCAEVGVQDGGFSECILDICCPQKLHLIDVWDRVPQSMVGAGDGSSDMPHETYYNGVINKFGNLPNVIINKGFSHEVAIQFVNDYFDWVYIDASHQEECVLRDLRLYGERTRTGGIIAGDDYGPQFTGFTAEVARAVHKYCDEMKLTLKSVGTQYTIQK